MFKLNNSFYQCTNKNIYTYIKVQQVKESKQGETEFPYKNCPPKRKDLTIKNRKLIHNYTINYLDIK